MGHPLTFSGGYVSQNDFAGGEVEIFNDEGVSGVFIVDPNDVGIILIADLVTTLASDALPSDLGAELIGSPFSFFSLTEPTGLIVSLSEAPDVGFGTPTTGPILFSVTVGYSTLLGDVNLDDVVDFSDIPAFIAVLQAGEYQIEADLDQNGAVDFGDIPLFITSFEGQ